MAEFQGRLKFWLPDRGFGFIQRDDCSAMETFLHVSDVLGDRYDVESMLRVGCRVEYDLGPAGRSHESHQCAAARPMKKHLCLLCDAPLTRGQKTFCSYRCRARSKSPLNTDKVRLIRMSGATCRELADRFGCSPVTAWRARNGLSWGGR